MRILFIDDEPTQIAKYEPELKINGHIISIEPNLDLALEKLSKVENQILYDIVFIDEDFGQTNQSTNLQTGEELIEKLSVSNEYAPLFYLSAVMDKVHTVKKVMGKYGVCYFLDKSREFDGKAIACINEMKELPNYKRIIELRKNKIEKELQNFFPTLTQQKALLWQQEIEKGEKADWSKFEVSIFGGTFKIDELLYDPIKELSNSEISSIISDHLSRSFKIGKFIEDFKDDSRISFERYLNLSKEEREAIEIEISEKALNYLLDTLQIFSQCDSGEEQVYNLNSRNKNISKATIGIGNITDVNRHYDLFIQKLILRRVVASLYYLYVNDECLNTIFHIDLSEDTRDEEKICKSYLANLIKDGYTHPTKSGHRDVEYHLPKKDIKYSFRGIGLNVADVEDIVKYNSSNYINPFQRPFLEEEETWVKEFAKYTILVRKCLDDIYNEINANKNIRTILPDNEVYTDLTDFREWFNKKIAKTQNEDKIRTIIKTNIIKHNVQSYFKEYLPVEVAHFGAGKLGLGLVAPIITQLGDKVVIINRNNENWQTLSTSKTLVIETNGQAIEFDYYHQDLLSDEQKIAIKDKWTNANKMQLIVVTNNEADIKFFIKDVQHITTSLKKGLSWAKRHINDINFSNLVTIYPFENDKKDVDTFYKDLGDKQFEQALLIADRVCTDTVFDNQNNKLMVYAEEYGHVVIKGNKFTNLFGNAPKIYGIDYIFCENEDEFKFYFEKKFRILNCVHASLAVLCYDKLLSKNIPQEQWGTQYLNLLKDDSEIKAEIHKIATGEIVKLLATTNPVILKNIYPDKSIEDVYVDLKKYSNSIFERFDKMADRLDRVLKLQDLIIKFDDRIDATINFFDGSNANSVNAIIDEITKDKPNLKEIDKTLRTLLKKVSKVIRTTNEK